MFILSHLYNSVFAEYFPQEIFNYFIHESKIQEAIFSIISFMNHEGPNTENIEHPRTFLDLHFENRTTLSFHLFRVRDQT